MDDLANKESPNSGRRSLLSLALKGGVAAGLDCGFKGNTCVRWPPGDDEVAVGP